MDPQYEQRLREEVVYLHSLWHQGPPSTRTLHPHLQPSTSAQFKKEGKNPNSKKPENKSKTKTRKPSPYQDSGVEWPCPPIPDPSPARQSGWPDFAKTLTNSETHLPPSPGKQARFLAIQAQSNALKAVSEFFKSINSDSDDSDGNEDDELMDEEEVANEGSEDCGSGFFTRLFEEEDDLREFYVKNFEDEEFSCLVCGGVGKTKRFKDCMALVQHTISIAKTKKRKEHRAYGQVVCKVLGWDINKLSSIVSLISEKRNGLMSKSAEGENNAQANSDNGNKDKQSNVVDNVDSVNDNNHEEVQGKKCNGNEQLPDNNEATESRGLLFASDPNGRGEDPNKEVAEGVVQNTEDTRNCMANSNNGNKEAINVVDHVDLVKYSNNEEIQGKESTVAKQLFDNGESAASEIPQSVNDPNGRAEDINTGIAEGEGNIESTMNYTEPHKE